jgi:rare lipoprotein A (peptidoglycan hydrolase)
VSAFVGLRAAALAAVAILGIAIALAVAMPDKKKETAATPAGQWYTALAAPYTATKPKEGACGIVIGPKTLGVAHPVLPCGVKVYLEFHGKQVLTQVIDSGHTAPGRVFDVTVPVAKLLGLQGSQTIRWRFAS